MAKFKKLQSHQGADEVNVEGVSYKVHNNEVSVPAEAVASLLHIGGFTVEPESDPVPEGLVLVTHGDASGCSWAGVNYDRREDGSFAVPCAAVADLLAHGFVAHEPAADPAE